MSKTVFRFALHWQILIAILLGCVFAFFLPEWVGYVSWLGDLFMRLLGMVVIPLVFCSLVSAMTGLKGAGKLGRLGVRTVAIYLLTSILAVTTALVLTNVIQPGRGVEVVEVSAGEELNMNLQSQPIRETLLNIVPKNLFSDLSAGNLLPVVLFAILFGIILARLRSSEPVHETGPDVKSTLHSVEILVRVFEAGQAVMLKMTECILLLAPLGVFGIIAKNVALFGGESEGFMKLGHGLGLLFITIFTGLAFHLFVTQSLVLRFLGRCRPWNHLRNMSAVLLTAFTTASSNGTLPLTLRDVVEKDGVSEETAGFVLPFGATVNMDGTSLYECGVVLFVAQAYGIELTVFQQFLTVLMVLLTGIGTAGIPMASLVMIVIVLNAVGLPPEGIGLVLAVDRPLDMCRTAVNVYGDTCCAVVVAKNEGEELKV